MVDYSNNFENEIKCDIMEEQKIYSNIKMKTLLQAMDNVGKRIGINTTGKETPEGYDEDTAACWQCCLMDEIYKLEQNGDDIVLETERDYDIYLSALKDAKMIMNDDFDNTIEKFKGTKKFID